MVTAISLLICLAASALGAICGIGGGVIIKPVLDSLGIYSVSTVNFLSGCTVLSMSGYTVLKIIHGYGSSGRGGRIRTEARAYLTRLQAKGQLKGFIPGERFSIFDADTRAAFLVCDALRQDHDLERHNNGVTFILL